MKLWVLFIGIISLNVQSLNIETVRTSYKAAAQDKTKVEAFHRSLSEIDTDVNSVLAAYKGASIALMAKQAKSIKDKKDGFINGVSYIEQAIERAPNNIEIRFVRLSIQENSPKILRYKANLDEDKQFIMAQFKFIKYTHLKNYLKDYISHSKVFTDEEKSVILKS